MPTSIVELVADAKTAVPRISPDELKKIIHLADVLVVDVRDHPEVERTGTVQGAIHVTRGMLEFRADRTSPYHDKAFSKAGTIVVVCASGGRSALCGKALLDLGYTNVFNLGGIDEWKQSGGPMSRPTASWRFKFSRLAHHVGWRRQSRN